MLVESVNQYCWFYNFPPRIRRDLGSFLRVRGKLDVRKAVEPSPLTP